MRARLNKILAQAGLTSRRGADRLVAGRRVVVNGEVAVTAGVLVDPTVDRVLVDGRPLPASEPHEYVLLNKPRGCVTTLRDPRGRPVVTDLLRGTRARLYPVGRLDWNVEGVLLLTNDGDLTHRLLHPRYALPRVYEATVAGRVAEANLPRWRAGVTLDDGFARPSAVKITRPGARSTVLCLTFTEGRKHEVKRYCEALGHPVTRLRRIAFGPLTLGDLRPGQTRPLTTREIASLRSAG
ncbi:MAG: pseudouridine synthase [Candidatus Rokuibacteriota bacterium]|nr:MAG: pseudouridine synthase [Candidatus Rokubacteria bacterium]